MPIYDSFLPSGAIASPPVFSPGRLSSPQVRSAGTEMTVAADYFGLRTSPPNNQQRPPYSRSSSVQSRRPISPPKTRSTSAEEKTASMIEDWRAYTKKIREQAEGERKHMAQDRDRIQEVQAEERALWDTERTTLMASITEQNHRIAELEREVEKLRASGLTGNVTGGRERSQGHGQAPIGAIAYAPGSIAVSVTGSVAGSSVSSVPQESGRDANGARFYAPTASNPSRTFVDPGADGLRVDAISLPRESPIRVTSSELSASSFGPQGPPTNGGGVLDKIPETPVENVDISLIHPGLEGIHIKTSAIEATFVATVLSPQGSSPAVLSPDGAPPRPQTNSKENRLPLSRETSASEREKIDTKTLILAPEDRRLTMHAGHTPNHSVTNLAGFTAESGSATPTKVNTQANQVHIHQNSESSAFDLADEEEEDVDKPLTGPLSLSNLPAKDEFFLSQLAEKLAKVEKEMVEEEAPEVEAEKSTKSALSDTTSPILGSSLDEIIGGEDEEPVLPLRMKSSTNFGAPFGRLGH